MTLRAAPVYPRRVTAIMRVTRVPHCGQWRVPNTSPFCCSFFSLLHAAASCCFIMIAPDCLTSAYIIFRLTKHLSTHCMASAEHQWLRPSSRRIPARPLLGHSHQKNLPVCTRRRHGWPRHQPIPSDDKRGPFSLRAPHQPSPADNPKESNTLWPGPTCLHLRNHIARPLGRYRRRTSMARPPTAAMYGPQALTE